MAKDNFFYGLEGNKLFKIYSDGTSLHAAKVASNIYDQKTARAIYFQFGLLGALLGSIAAKKAVARRAALEAKYDELAPGSPPFREGDKANFTLSSGDILSATVKPKATGFKGAFSPGAILELALSSGKKRKFVLIEDQNATFVKNLVAGVASNTQLLES